MVGDTTSDETKLPASAPISEGVKPLLVCPSKSVVTHAMADPVPSTGVGLVGWICRLTLEVLPAGLIKDGSALKLLASFVLAVFHKAIVPWFTVLKRPRMPPVPGA